MSPGVTSTGARVRVGGGSTAASAFKKLPGLGGTTATGAGLMTAVQKPMKIAEEGPDVRDRLGGFARGAQTGAVVGGLGGAALAANYMTQKPGVISRAMARILRSESGPAWGGAAKRLGGGIIAGTAIGGGIGAMTSKQSDRTKAATSASGGVESMAEAMEAMLAGSVDPTRGFSFVEYGFAKAAFEKDAGINRTMRMVESVGRKVIRGKEVPQGLAAATGRSTFHTAKRMEGLAKGLAAKGDAFEAGLHGAGRGLPPFGMGRIAGNVHATAKGYAEPITGAAHRLAGVARRESSSNVAGRVESMAGAVRRNSPDTAAGRIGKKLKVRTPGFMEGITKRKPMTADEAGVMGARAAGEYNAMRGSAVQGQGRPMQKMRKRLWGN